MKRLTSLAAAAVVAVLAVAATGCDISPNAAVVNGKAISQATLNSTLSDLSSSPAAQCTVLLEYASSSAAPSQIVGAGDDTVTQQAAGFELTNLIVQRVLTQELARRHGVVTSEDLADAKADLGVELDQTASQLESEGQSLPAACSAVKSNPLQHLPATVASQLFGSLAVQEQLGAAVGHVDISTPGLERFYHAHSSDFDEVCLAVLFTTSQSAAEAVHAKIVAGQSFGAAVSDPGIDPEATQNGQTVCLLPGSVISDFGQQSASVIYAAGVGQLLNPIAFTLSSGATDYLVMQMQRRQLVPFSEEETTIREDLLSSAASATEALLHRLVVRADVWINPQYGSWDTRRATPVVAAPPAPAVHDQLNAAANTTSLGGSVTSPGG